LAQWRRIENSGGDFREALPALMSDWADEDFLDVFGEKAHQSRLG